MSNQKTLFLMFAATAIAGTVGGVMVALQFQRSPGFDVNNSPHQAQVSPSSSMTATPTTTPETPETVTPTPTPTPTVTPTAKPEPTAEATAEPTAEATAEPKAEPTPEPVEINPPTEGCKITQAAISDPNPPINVRSIPRVTSNNKVGTLENGTLVTVVGEEETPDGDWFRIDRPIQGWISQKLTKSSCSNVSERIQFPANGSSAIVQGEIIGGGTHQYILEASAGQTLSIEKLNDDSVFPTIMSPNGRVLAGDPYTDDRRSQWVGQLPSSGDYRLEMNSNFKGFKYHFYLEVK